MPTPTILLADNNKEFLSTCAEFLEGAGYQVLKASNPNDVRSIFQAKHFHLAILDLRLTDDDNDKDRSGLLLAKELGRTIPKLILTRFPSFEDVREAMKIDEETFPPAVDFVDKRKGLDPLLFSVRQAFSSYVRINWGLTIDWKAREVFGLVRAIEPDINNDRLLQRTDEFQNLLCSIFHDKDYVRIDRVLWQEDRRIALIIFAFKEGFKSEAAIVVCGQNAAINQEAQRFTTYSPRIPGETGTLLISTSETTHFAANTYMLKDNNLESVQTLLELYRSGPEKILNTAVTSLFQSTLKSWHQEKPIRVKNKTLGGLYLESLHLTGKSLDEELFERRLRTLEHQALTLGVSIERLDGDISFHYDERSYKYSNPVKMLDKETLAADLVVNTPGILSGSNILVDSLGRTWVTDFANAGQLPSLWNYISLESAIRFDWAETQNIFHLHEMEKCLINSDFNKPDARDLELPVRKPIRAIQIIRKLAATGMGKDTFAYHQGIFFQGLKRFSEFNFESPLTPGEIVRMVHILISISILATLLEQGKRKISEIRNNEYPELRIDQMTNIILIGNQRRHLSPRPFKLLQYLFENSNRVCTIEELREKVIGQNYNTTYVHTLVGRIREAIESEPEKPRYLISEPNIGYRLVVRPK